jgi:hypothetical protein
MGVGNAAKGLYSAGCGTMIPMCPEGKKQHATADCCYSSAEVSSASANLAIASNTWDKAAYLYKKCARRELEEDSRRNLAAETVTFTANPEVSYNDADTLTANSIKVDQIAADALTAAQVLAVVQTQVKAVTTAIAAGQSINGLSAAQMTGDAAVTSLTDMQTKFTALATTTATAADTMTVQKPTFTETGAPMVAATSNAVTTALSGAVIFVFAFLF